MGEALKKNPTSGEEADAVEEDVVTELQLREVEETDDYQPVDENDQVLDIIGMTVANGNVRDESDDSNREVEEEDLEGDEDDMDSDNESDDDFPIPDDDSDSEDVTNIFSVTAKGRVVLNWRASRYR